MKRSLWSSLKDLSHQGKGFEITPDLIQVEAVNRHVELEGSTYSQRTGDRE